MQLTKRQRETGTRDFVSELIRAKDSYCVLVEFFATGVPVYYDPNSPSSEVVSISRESKGSMPLTFEQTDNVLRLWQEVGRLQKLLQLEAHRDSLRNDNRLYYLACRLGFRSRALSIVLLI